MQLGFEVRSWIPEPMVCTKLPCTATQGVNGMTEGERKRLEGDVRKSVCLVTRKKMVPRKCLWKTRYEK